MAWALGASGAVYGAAMLALTSGLVRLRRERAILNREIPSVSVIVAARDEEASIARCLDALIAQDYPRDRFEVVVVDDRSSDRTFEIARSYEERNSSLLVLRVKEARYACPKKNALALGIARSRGEILLTTDADCRPGPGWVAALVRRFTPDVGMVAGHSPPDPGSGLVARILALEALAKAGLAAGSIGIGLPLSCTGRNLAYRRAAFDAVGGFDRIGHIVSGDDVLLMRLIASRTPWKVRYQTEAIVPTAAGSPSPRGLYHQKARHASKALHYGAPILVPAGILYLFHALLLVGLPMAPASPGVFQALAIALGGKAVVDLLFLRQTARTLGAPAGTLRYLPLLEAAYVPYVVVFSVLGSMKRFKWKSRA
jgi:cellulose synthase/poly-beta-1,6-N-acetylglucosamine synthase-like glycosyltransferase